MERFHCLSSAECVRFGKAQSTAGQRSQQARQSDRVLRLAAACMLLEHDSKQEPEIFPVGGFFLR
ncbi:MAG TPA: hypothetical protein DCQ06_00235 [Myxococcales bacterium]|nr:hypothetical protein [Myxococcales bacterium]HAN29998.1 hypothetical protein [Myxococcales bacterium]